MDEELRRRSEAYAAAVRGGVRGGPLLALAVAADELGQEQNVVFEVGCARLVLDRLHALDALSGDVGKVARSTRALNRALVGAARLQAQIEAGGGSDVSAALAALLAVLER